MSVAATAVRPQNLGLEIHREHESYARSTVAMQELGRVACMASFEANEAEGLVQEVWNDFITAVEENLSTDPEYGDRLKFNPLKQRDIVDGLVVDMRGRPLIDVVMEGLESSKRAAVKEPEMEIQVDRDKGDVQVAQTVDTLDVGEMYVVISLDPKEALQRNKKYWEAKGYREGMAVAQVYYRKDKNTMLAGAYSIKESDPKALRRILTKHGKELPIDISDSHWTRHGLRKKADLIEAQSFGHQLQEDHRQEINKPYHEISVTDLIAANRDTVQSYFDMYVKPLCEARHTGQVNQTIQGLAQALLTNLRRPEDKVQLEKIAGGGNFTVNDTSFMEEKIRYALVEELRQKIPDYINRNVQPTSITIHENLYTSQPNQQAIAGIEAMNQRIAANVARGEAAGRSYGGCSGAGSKRDRLDSIDDLDPSDPQNIWAGKDANEEERSEEENVECDYKGTFCYCCPYNSDGTSATKPYEVTARREKDGVAYCLRAGCGATLDSKGNARKGLIYEKAMYLQKKDAA